MEVYEELVYDELVYDELLYDDFVDIAPIYIRINVEDKSNFYYLETIDAKVMHIILEQIKNIKTDEANRILIQNFIKNEDKYVETCFLDINGLLKYSKLFKIPNNPASCYQPAFLKDLNKQIYKMDPEYDIIYSGSKFHTISAYKSIDKKIGHYQEYI